MQGIQHPGRAIRYIFGGKRGKQDTIYSFITDYDRDKGSLSFVLKSICDRIRKLFLIKKYLTFRHTELSNSLYIQKYMTKYW